MKITHGTKVGKSVDTFESARYSIIADITSSLIVSIHFLPCSIYQSEIKYRHNYFMYSYITSLEAHVVIVEQLFGWSTFWQLKHLSDCAKVVM